MKKNYYMKKKEELREYAKDVQREIIEKDLAWWDYIDAIDDIEQKARKYGLLKEFRENGIIGA